MSSYGDLDPDEVAPLDDEPGTPQHEPVTAPPDEDQPAGGEDPVEGQPGSW